MTLTFTDPIETGDEVLVAHDGQPNKREHAHQDVKDESAVLTRVLTHQRLGKLQLFQTFTMLYKAKCIAISFK